MATTRYATMRSALVCLLAACTACSEPSPETSGPVVNAPVTSEADRASPSPVASPSTASGTEPSPVRGAEVTLQPMAFADFEAANLMGSGCTFHAPEPGDVIFVVIAEGGPGAKPEAGAGVKVAGEVLPMRARPADYDAMTRGVTAAGSGFAVSVEPRSGPGSQSGTETRDWPAEMTFTPAAGTPTTLAGLWQCGS